MQPHQQIHDEDATFRIQERNAIPRGQISDQRIHQDTREGKTWNSTNAPTEKLKKRRETEREGTKEEGLVQTRWVRHSPIHNNDARWKTEEDV